METADAATSPEQPRGHPLRPAEGSIHDLHTSSVMLSFHDFQDFHESRGVSYHDTFLQNIHSHVDVPIPVRDAHVRSVFVFRINAVFTAQGHNEFHVKGRQQLAFTLTLAETIVRANPHHIATQHTTDIGSDDNNNNNRRPATFQVQ